MARYTGFDIPTKLKCVFRMMYAPDKLYSFSDIERLVGYSAKRGGNPIIRELCNDLVSKNILIFKKRVFAARYYKIDKKKLFKYIKDLDGYKEFVKLIKNTNIIIW